MKTVQQLQEEVYQQALNSGCFRNLQSQLKTYVFELIEKEYNNGKSKKGFEYQHPLLPKLKKYPLTSLCMDLIQQFLQSFKFKHTLNVFKKEINRTATISRSSLAEQFKIQIKNPQSQAILLSLVSQMFTGQIGAIKNNNNIKINNFVDSNRQQQSNNRNNNFINQPSHKNIQKQQQNSTLPNFKKQNNGSSLQQSKSQSQKSINQNSNVSKSSIPSSSQNQNSSSSNIKKEETSQISSSSKQETSKENSSSLNGSQSKIEKQEEKKKKGGKQEKKKVQKQPPRQAATDFFVEVMNKFGQVIKKPNKQQQKKQLFESKRAFSQQKEKKVLDPSQSGANKIRGASLGPNIGSFMSKFMPQKQQPQKNDSYIDEQLDQFQQSKDSTRKNPLFSSSQSGFDKSGFDVSVDSNAIEQYEYYERAKKPLRKM